MAERYRFQITASMTGAAPLRPCISSSADAFSDDDDDSDGDDENNYEMSAGF